MKWNNRGHEFDAIGERLIKVKKLYFYGIGGHVKEIFGVIKGAEKFFDLELNYVDRNEKVREKGFEGHEIISPEEFFEKIQRETDYLVVACPLGCIGEEIREIVISHGVSEENVVTGYDFIFTYLPIFFLYKHGIVFFTSQNIVPSSACNLNCRECLNFNPYIKTPVVHGFEEVKRDIDVFFNAVDLIYRFQVTGGEPFLYPHTVETLTYIRENYGSKIMRLETVTNGTIVPSDELCECLAKEDVHVYLDDYTLALTPKHKSIRCEIEEKFKKFGVKYFDNYVDRWFKIYPAKEAKGEEELENFFEECANPWSTIEGGKISACNYELYAQKAGLVEGEENDFYDLTQFDSTKKKELVEFRLRFNEKGYTSFCSKCAGFSVINDDLYYPAIQVRRGEQ